MTWLTYVAARPGADLLAIASNEGWLGVWMPTDNRVVATQALGVFVNKCGWNVDGTHLLATAGDELVVLSPDGKDRIRSIATKHEALRTFAAHPSLASVVVTTGGDGVVRLWDITTGAQTGEVMAKQGKGSNGGTALAISETAIVVGYRSGFIAMCDHDGKNVGAAEMFGGGVGALACLPARSSFLVGGGKGKIAQVVIEPTTFRVAQVWDDPPKPYAVNTIEVDGERFVAACSDNSACYFSGVGVYSPDRLGDTAWNKAWKQSHIVSAACFVGSKIVTSHFTGVVKLWNPEETWKHVEVTFDDETPRWKMSDGTPIDDPIAKWRELG